jgi:hypothetical protein
LNERSIKTWFVNQKIPLVWSPGDQCWSHTRFYWVFLVDSWLLLKTRLDKDNLVGERGSGTGSFQEMFAAASRCSGSTRKNWQPQAKDAGALEMHAYIRQFLQLEH